MRITDCRANWMEDAIFSLWIPDAGNQYVFMQFLSPAKLHAPYCDIAVPVGACILFDRRAPLRISFEKQTARFGWFSLQGDLSKETEKYDIEFNRIYYPNSADITQILCSIEKALMTKHPYFDDLCAWKAKELLLALTQNSTRPQPRINCKTPLENLRAAIVAHYADKWTTTQMCALSKLSKHTLVKSYKQMYGVTPKEDLLSIRIQHAKFMLLTQNLTVKEIAARLKFSSTSAFSKHFKLHTGILPSVYKYSL